MRMQFFDKSDKKILQEGWEFFTESKILIKKVSILQNSSFFLDMILCLCRIQFRQPRRKLYVKWPKNFRWMSKNGLTFLSTEKNFSSPWTGTLLFRQSLLKIFHKRPIFSAHCREVKRKSWNVFFKLLSSNRSYGQVECTFDNTYKNILREGWKIFTPCPKLIQILIC